MKLWPRVRSVLLWLPLAFVVVFTLFQETSLSDSTPAIYLWSLLLNGWIARLMRSWRRTRNLPRRALVLPVCAVVVFGFAQTSVPIHLLFRAQEPMLQRALSRRANKDGEVADLSLIGMLAPKYIYKEGKATCFWFWENTDGFWGDDYESGFAYCPGDAGCQRADFEQGETPDITLSADENLGGDWYRVSRWLHH